MRGSVDLSEVQHQSMREVTSQKIQKALVSSNPSRPILPVTSCVQGRRRKCRAGAGGAGTGNAGEEERNLLS